MFKTLYIDFEDAQRQVNSVVSGRIWLKFKPIQAFMHVLVTCKNKEDPIKNEFIKALECPQHVSHYKSMVIFSRRSRAANSAVCSLIWPNFELIRDSIVVHFTCKNEEDPIKNEVANVLTMFSQLQVYLIVTLSLGSIEMDRVISETVL